MVNKAEIRGDFLESVQYEIYSGSIWRPLGKEACFMSQKIPDAPGFGSINVFHKGLFMELRGSHCIVITLKMLDALPCEVHMERSV